MDNMFSLLGGTIPCFARTPRNDQGWKPEFEHFQHRAPQKVKEYSYQHSCNIAVEDCQLPCKAYSLSWQESGRVNPTLGGGEHQRASTFPHRRHYTIDMPFWGYQIAGNSTFNWNSDCATLPFSSAIPGKVVYYFQYLYENHDRVPLRAQFCLGGVAVYIHYRWRQWRNDCWAGSEYHSTF